MSECKQWRVTITFDRGYEKSFRISHHGTIDTNPTVSLLQKWYYSHVATPLTINLDTGMLMLERSKILCISVTEVEVLDII